jgi:hypothetical protein
MDASGRLVLFARGAEDELWHNRQRTPGGEWAGWSSLGGWVGGMAVALDDNDRLHVLAQGSDNALWERTEIVPGEGWSGWRSLGGWIRDPSAIRDDAGTLRVFARGADNALLHRSGRSDRGWSGWESLGGWVREPVAVLASDGSPAVVARGVDAALWFRSRGVSGRRWRPWRRFHGKHPMTSPVAVAAADGVLEAFAQGPDHSLWHGQAWIGDRTELAENCWDTLHGHGGWIRDPAAVRNFSGEVEIFAQGRDHELWWLTATEDPEGGAAWVSLGGWVRDPAVATNVDGSIEVVVQSTDGGIWHRRQIGDRWTGWAPIDGWLDRPIEGTDRGRPELDLLRAGSSWLTRKGRDGRIPVETPVNPRVGAPPAYAEVVERLAPWAAPTSAVTWAEVEQAVGIRLPADFKQLMSRLPSGRTTERLFLWSPVESTEMLEAFVTNMRTAVATTAGVLESILTPPYPEFPEPGSLLPWGFSLDETWLWETVGDPDAWPAMHLTISSGHLVRYPGTASALLRDLLAAPADGPPHLLDPFPPGTRLERFPD